MQFEILHHPCGFKLKRKIVFMSFTSKEYKKYVYFYKNIILFKNKFSG